MEKQQNLKKKLLLDIRTIIMKYHISIPTIAADGDSGYNSLHQKYFDSFFSQSTNPNSYLISECHKNILMTICDPLHMLKRARYRLLKRCPPTTSLFISNRYILKQHLKSILNLNEIIINDNNMTKMHDNLPILLFCPENLLILLKNQEYDYAAYFLPWTLLIISLSSAFNLIRIQRIQLLELSCYCLIGYYMILKNTNLPPGLTENLTPNTIYISNNV